MNEKLESLLTSLRDMAPHLEATVGMALNGDDKGDKEWGRVHKGRANVAVAHLKKWEQDAKELLESLSRRPLPQNSIYGHMFRVSSPNAEEYEERTKEFIHHVDSGFRNAYQHHHGAKQSIAQSAKVYLEKNWKNVKDWTQLSVFIVDNTGDRTEYFNYNESQQERSENSFFDLHDYYSKRHNPVSVVSEMVLDHSDGDFSVCINGHWHNWIDDDSVIMLADYVESQLAAQETNAAS